DLLLRDLDLDPVHDHHRPLPRPRNVGLGEGRMDLLPDLRPVPDGADLPDRAWQRDAGPGDPGPGGREETLRPVRPRNRPHLARRRTAQTPGAQGKGRAQRRGVPAGEGETARLSQASTRRPFLLQKAGFCNRSCKLLATPNIGGAVSLACAADVWFL